MKKNLLFPESLILSFHVMNIPFQIYGTSSFEIFSIPTPVLLVITLEIEFNLFLIYNLKLKIYNLKLLFVPNYMVFNSIV
jgi:hypothetical protein